MPDAAELGTLVQSVGLVGGMALILLAGFRQIWVWGHQLRKVETDRDFWRDMALRGLTVAEKAADVAQRKSTRSRAADG